MTGRDWARRYAPLLALLAGQTALVIAAPSTPVRQADFSGQLQGAAVPSVSDGGGDQVQAGSSPAEPGAAGAPDAAGAAVAPQGAGSGTASTEVGRQSAAGGAGRTGSTAHCTADGRQFAELYQAPPCLPAWPDGVSNGGRTATGVDAKSVRVVVYRRSSNPVADSALSSQNLGATREQFLEFMKAAERFINAKYELHGRTLTLEPYFSTCRLSPPDNPCYREDAKAIAKRSFLVVYPNAVPPSLFEEFARQRIVSIGGWNYDGRLFDRSRPYRWDVHMDGSTAARFLSEYYCKRLRTGKADRAGTTIHPSIGRADQTPRKLGVVVSDDPAQVPPATSLQAAVEKCTGSDVPVFRIINDTSRAQEQATSVVAGLIREKVTTVAYMGDAINPVFLTNAASQQSYYPEWLVSGVQLIDLDPLGRLYDRSQWAHAFGLSPLPPPAAPAATDAGKVWKAVGGSGDLPSPIFAEVFWQSYSLAATMLHLAGPTLSPPTIDAVLSQRGYERGGHRASGGRPDVVLWNFGPDDRTAVGDVREVVWDPDAVSPADGRRGTYTSLSGGRRYELGSLPSSPLSRQAR